MVSSLGKATPLTPALNARISVWFRCLPFGRMHPKTKGFFGNISLADNVTLAKSIGLGGLILDIMDTKLE